MSLFYLSMIAKHFSTLQFLKMNCLEDMIWESTKLQAFFPFWWIYWRICAVHQVLIPVRSASDDRESAEVCWSDSRLTWHPHVWRVLTMDVAFLLPGDERPLAPSCSPQLAGDSRGNLLTVTSPPMQVRVRRGDVDSSNLEERRRRPVRITLFAWLWLMLDC